MKKIICIIISLAALASAVIYLYFDGLIPYIIQRSITPPIKLIEYYSGIEFPPETEIENVTFYSYDDPNTDDPSGGVFEATLIVTSDLIDDLFPKKTRKYSEFYMSFISENDQPDYDFTVTKTRVVRRWNMALYRYMNFSALKPENGTVKIYVSIDQLGWYEYDKWKL